MSMMRYRYDEEADALYIRVREEGIVERTEQIDPGTLVDVDGAGHLLGIEVIRPGRPWPLEAILDEYPVDDETRKVLTAQFAASKPIPFGARHLVGA